MANPGNDTARRQEADSSSENEARICSKCGHQGAEQSRFCPECGARVPLLRPHEIFDDRYEVIRVLSQGPATEVYEVRHLELGEPRSIKILRPELFLEESQTLRFRREAKLASRIRHANVAELYDFVAMKDGGYYMVWEYFDGRTLREWSDEGAASDALAVVDVGIQVLNGLGAIHAAGIVHRDISPETILIAEGAGATREGSAFRAKIADLGIAKGLDPSVDDAATEVGRFMGNVQYSSPEQAGMSDEQLDGRSDLYSLGVTLYEMLSGDLPFRALTPQGYLERHVSATPRPLNEAAPDADFPASLDSVISRSIQKDREKRYQTVAEFRDALLEARKDLSESNRPLAASKGNVAVERLPATAAVPVIPSNIIESSLSDTKADDRHRESEPAAFVSTEQSASASVTAVAETSSAPATKAPVVIPVPDHAPAEPVVERSGFETTTLESSAATRDVSANNTYDPLARKKFQWGLWIPLLVLGGLILWGIWVMTRPGPDEQEGTLAITATSTGVPADATEADGVTSKVSSVAQLPPNIIEGSDGLGAGDGSILREIPADPTASGGEPADLTAQPGQLTPTQAESPAVADPQFPNPQVSEREAINIIVTGVNRTNYYGVEARCLGVGSSRYVNGGYTIELIARSCPGGGRAPGALLGRWRVDGRTGDAYVQNSQGKYVSP